MTLPDSPSDASPMPRLVGIGASAGGLESLRRLLAVLPSDLGLSFVVLQHLSPTHRSMLSEILQSHTSMPVREVRDGDRPCPNEVLVTRKREKPRPSGRGGRAQARAASHWLGG